jgi:ABC-type transport system involved in multi-copper enzyme maturation permease subunit
MPSAHLARLVLIEARRGALPWLAVAALLVSLALAAFLSQVALTESRALQLAIVGALGRACAVFLIAAHVATSLLREMNDKGMELMLSLPLARSAQYLGRLAGFAACGALLAAVFAAPLFVWATPAAVALWALSLALECALVAAASLFFAVSLGQHVAALAATAGLYLLARSIAGIQAIAASPFAEDSVTHALARWGVDGVALLLPRLDAVTRTDWLLYGTPEPRAYLQALAGLVIYGALLVAAGLFDFQRESF